MNNPSTTGGRREKIRGLDQFYTKPEVAAGCWKKLSPLLRELTGKNDGDLFFIEPSAGDGVFYDLLPPKNRIGVDIAPRRGEILQQDFLEWNRKNFHFSRRDRVVIGNPPFGTRGDLAVKFFNKAATLADTVAFIVPVIFRKHFIHKQLHPDFCWPYSTPLPRDSFRTQQKESYEVNTEFQVWTRLCNTRPNLRLFAPPPIKHADFIMHQYNNTTAMLKVFNEDFDFAVPSQGWQDYRRRETRAEDCEKHKQWILFKCGDKTVFGRLHEEMNYEKLARKNITSIPGFRKGDVVQEYICNYG